MGTSQQVLSDENTELTKIRKEIVINWEVVGLGFVASVVFTQHILPFFMIWFSRVLFHDPIFLFRITIGFPMLIVRLVIGLVVGLKVKKYAWLNGLVIGVLMFGYDAMQSFHYFYNHIWDMLIIFLLEVISFVVGAFIGGIIVKSKTK